MTLLPLLKMYFLSLLQFLFPLSSIPMMSFLTSHLYSSPQQFILKPTARIILWKCTFLWESTGDLFQNFLWLLRAVMLEFLILNSYTCI
jgi:hypothetical protein